MGIHMIFDCSSLNFFPSLGISVAVGVYLFSQRQVWSPSLTSVLRSRSRRIRNPRPARLKNTSNNITSSITHSPLSQLPLQLQEQGSVSEMPIFIFESGVSDTQMMFNRESSWWWVGEHSSMANNRFSSELGRRQHQIKVRISGCPCNSPNYPMGCVHIPSWLNSGIVGCCGS